ncbi:carbohydrate binding family 9 domain-containing protein [Gammaproteobacteria bacterium]|nr:carbohydrate binding family 9 domain-containing protein [Gammaproteobacteria bacterium]MDB2443709.1 carbohydrate binding family 9 domain-containing protein [Gammaproteobacteria bacterium]
MTKNFSNSIKKNYQEKRAVERIYNFLEKDISKYRYQLLKMRERTELYLHILLLSVTLILAVLPQKKFAADYFIPFTANQPTIDGILSDNEWLDASEVYVNVETDPADSVKSAVKTKALLMENGETLFIAFMASDENPNQIRAFYRDRDLLWSDDYVGVSLDTFNDERRAYEFWVNPLGVQADGTYDDINQKSDASWNAIWQSAGKINGHGYTVEMAIPFKQLRFSPNKGTQQWGLELVRRYPRDRNTRIANAIIDRDVSCRLCQFSKAEGMNNIEAGQNLEIIPSFTMNSIRRRDPSENTWQNNGIKSDTGVDLRWGISQDLFLNATLNPDFSQVEADSVQLDTNNTFSLYFPERRTFFLDGADYFDTFENLVYTRNISNPNFGVKITGKKDAHSYAFLTANDKKTQFIAPRSLSSSVTTLRNELGDDLSSNIAIGRYRLDIFKNSSIGALITDRRSASAGVNYKNTVKSFDAVLRPTNSDTIAIQTINSSSNTPLQQQTKSSFGNEQSGQAKRLEYRHVDSVWDWRIGLNDFSEGFRADLGFVNRVDYKYFVTTIGRSWRSNGEKLFNRIRLAIDYDRTENQAGLELEEELELFINMNGPSQSYLNGLFGGSKTYWNGHVYNEQFNQISLGFSPRAAFKLGMYLRLEDVVDFRNSGLGRSLRFGPEARLQLGQHMQINLNFTQQKFKVAGGQLFETELIDLRATYQFSTQSYVRFTLQNNDRSRNPHLYIKPVNKRDNDLSLQLLYSYRYNAATRFFIGYSDVGYQNENIKQIYSTNQAFFAKFTYAFQY